MNRYTITELVALARVGSRYYERHFRSLPMRGFSLEDIPVTTYADVVEHVHGDFRELIAGGNPDGFYYTSSATTGQAKTTLYGRDEWKASIQMLANSHWRNRTIVAGDVVANLCAPGAASSRLVHATLAEFPGACAEVPLGADAPSEDICRAIDDYRITTLAATHSTLVGLAEVQLRNRGPNERVLRIVAGGELLYGAQERLIRAAFPAAGFCSFLYASNEAGFVGFNTFADETDEFLVFDQACVVEIVDPTTHAVIREVARPGILVVTNLLRRQAPAIRLAIGDMAEWVEPPTSPSSHFRLRGRTYPFRVALCDTTIGDQDVWRMLERVGPAVPVAKLQVVASQSVQRPALDVQFATFPERLDDAAAAEVMVEALLDSVPGLRECVQRDACPRPTARQLPLSHFTMALRRKGRLFVDERTPAPPPPIPG